MDTTGTRFLTLAMFAVVSILVTGCSDQRAAGDLPPLLKIGLLPDVSAEIQATRYEPLRRHLSETLGLPCELVFHENYNALVESFDAGTVDLANFGGLTFVQARNACNAVPLVMRDVDTRFTSYFLVRTDSPAKSVDDCENRTLAFGSRLSTSGHLMPRHFLALQDITPEIFFRDVRYSGAHDTTVNWVRDGLVELGAVNSQVFKAMLTDGRVQKGEFRIVWETPPYPNYVWAVQSSLGKTGRTKLRDAFLVLSLNNEQHEEILRNMNAGGYLPADAEAYSDLEEIASTLEVLQ